MQPDVLGLIDEAHPAAPDPLDHAVMGNTEFDDKLRPVKDAGLNTSGARSRANSAHEVHLLLAVQPPALSSTIPFRLCLDGDSWRKAPITLTIGSTQPLGGDMVR